MTFKDSIDCISKFEFEKKVIIDGLLQAETNEEKITALRILSRHDFPINIKEYKGCLRISIYKKEFINKLNMFNCPKLKRKWIII